MGFDEVSLRKVFFSFYVSQVESLALAQDVQYANFLKDVSSFAGD